MSADLGTWSRPQAQALVKVLKRAGLRPTLTAHPDGESIVVTVPEDQADRANAAIAADMDTIARAARQARDREHGASVHRIDTARRDRARSRGRDERRLATERLRGLAPVLGLLLATVLVATLVPGPARFPVLIVVVIGLTYAIGRGRGGGPGA